MGADRGLLIICEQQIEPLTVAKVLKEVCIEESPRLVIMGTHAIDDDCNQTGQMLAALLDWPQGTFASKIELGEERIVVTREVDGGLQTLDLKLPAIITTDLRLNEPRYASLPNIMKARKKPIEEKSIADYGINPTPRLKTLEVTEPPKRRAGMRVDSASALVEKLREAGAI
jgi:electron transfer flavoprotein beta subunit